MRNGPVRYANPFGRLMYVIAAFVLLAITLLGVPYFGIVGYWGWGGTVAVVLLIVVSGLAGLSYTVYVSVEVEPGRVSFRGLLYKRIVVESEVERIELDPPVHTLSLKWDLVSPVSALIIYRKGKHYVNANAMPDGLKIRIANALQPARFPLPQ